MWPNRDEVGWWSVVALGRRSVAAINDANRVQQLARRWQDGKCPLGDMLHQDCAGPDEGIVELDKD